jgi:hypothetical protein
MKYLKTFETINEEDCNCQLSEELEYALNEGLFSSFRYGSEKFFQVINEARENMDNLILSQEDIDFLNTDIGKKAIYEGEEVWLDCPMIDESVINENENDKYKGKRSGKPSRNSGGKAYKVYVAGCNEKTKTNPRGIKKLTFGSGMRAKIDDPDARKRYDSRHGCSKGKHNDKCKPGYWSCRLPQYSKQLGLSYNGSALWW